MAKAKQIKITITHSRWGTHTLLMEKHYYTFQGEKVYSWTFKYPDGNFMGDLDVDGGGGLSHPDPKVADFLRFYDIYLMDHDQDGYLELEGMLLKEIERVDHGYLTEGVFDPSRDDRAPLVKKTVVLHDGSERTLGKLPTGRWTLVGANDSLMSMDELAELGWDHHGGIGFYTKFDIIDQSKKKV